MVQPVDQPVDQRAEQLSEALWAGFIEDGSAGLRELIVAGDGATAARAAYLLNCWLWAQDEPLEAVAKMNVSEPRHAVMIALDEASRGDVAGAHRRLTAMVDQHPDDANLRLHLANLETDPLQRLAHWNHVLTARSGAPIEAGVESFEGLRVGAIAPVSAGPLVSVIVPIWNSSATLRAAVTSLRSQTYRNLQILLVDDASTDGSQEVARELAQEDDRITVITMPVNGGAYHARNTGWREAQGQLITVHDPDDWAHPERIARQVEFIAVREAVMAVGSYLVRVDPQLRAVVHGREPAVVVGRNTASLMYRRSALKAVGCWDDRVRGAADYELRRRVEHRFGLKSVAHIGQGLPMVWSLRQPGSLTSASVTGMQSLWHVQGARRQFVESFEWHHRHRGLEPEYVEPEYVVPGLLRGAAPEVRCDLAVTADLGEGSSDLAAVWDLLVPVSDYSVVLIHVPGDVGRVLVPVAAGVWERVDGHRVRVATSGETVICARHETVSPSALGSLDLAVQVQVQ